MKRLSFFLLACSVAASLTACDYNKTPGKDPQASQDFTEAPAATANETDRDSLSGGQRVETPIGKGSAADQKTSADAGLQSAPGNASSPVNNMPQESQEARSTVGKD